MSAVFPEIHRDSIDGVPVLWADAPPPGGGYTAALQFRVGRADESLAAGGITHLTEHLALWRLGQQTYAYNGITMPDRTIFVAEGQPEQLRSFLTSVCEALSVLPFERLDVESGVLRTEAASRASAPPSVLLGLRFGPRTFGLAPYPEHGLRWLDATAVRAWAEHQFTSDNAAIWFTGPPPQGLRLPLPRGRRMPLPALVEIERVDGCAWFEHQPPWVGLSLIGPRDTALTVAAGVLTKRSEQSLRYQRGLSYSVVGSYEPLTADDAHLVVFADAADGRGAAVADGLEGVAREVADKGPTDQELAEMREATTGTADVNAQVASWLDYATHSELVGHHAPSMEQLREDRLALTGDMVRSAAAQALTRGLLASPAVTQGLKDRLPAYPAWSKTTVRGKTFSPSPQGRANLGPDHRLIVGEDGVSHLVDRERVVTIRYADCEAVLWWKAGNRRIEGHDASVISLTPSDWNSGMRAVAEIDRRIPPNRFVPMSSGHRSLAAPALARQRPTVAG